MSRRAAARWMIRLLPRELREEYGDDFVTLLRERVAEESQTRGRGAALCYRFHALRDLVQTAMRGRLGAPGSENPSPRQTPVSSWLDAAAQDLRYGVRQLARNPGFTFVAMLTLALGIGVNAAVFNLVNARLRPPPVHDPGALVTLWQSNAARPDRAPAWFSYPDYLDYRDRTDVFSGLLAYRITTSGISGGAYPEQVYAEQVSGNYFEVLGVNPSLGRGLRPADNDPVANPVAVISDALWRRQYGGDPEVVGAEIALNGADPFTIVGVAPAGYWGVGAGARTELWYPLAMRSHVLHGDPQGRSDPLAQRDQRMFSLIGRLAPGRTAEQAQAATTGLAAALAREYDDTNEGLGVVVTSGVGLPPGVRADFVRWSWLALGAALTVLLIACVNLSGMLLARALDRRREIAIRLAVGASRGRLLGQLMGESLLLALACGGFGLVLAEWVSSGLATVLPAQMRRDIDLTIDLRVAGFVIAISLLAALAFGLAPAWRLSSRGRLPMPAGVTAGHRHKQVIRKLLLASQVAASVVLLVAAGLFAHSLQRFNATERGFDSDNVVRAWLWTGPFGYDDGTEIVFLEKLLEQSRELSGVRGASLGGPPWVNAGRRAFPVWPLIRGPVDEDAPEQVAFNVVGAGYLDVLGMTVIRGRAFDEHDARVEANVALVSESMARRLWPNRDPLGEQLVLLPAPPHLTERRSVRVIGIATDTMVVTRERMLGSSPADSNRLPAKPTVIIPLWMATPPSSYLSLWLKVAVPPESLAPVLRERLQTIDPTLVLFQGRLAERLESLSTYERTYSTFTGLFGFLAAGLCAVGLYGTMAHAVSRRRREIGVRMALGARQSIVVGSVVRQGLVPTALGLVVGISAALALSRIIASVLYEVSPTDPLTYSAVAALVISVTLAASWIPARRAARVDPIETLRVE